jgi:hypothetical protein
MNIWVGRRGEEEKEASKAPEKLRSRNLLGFSPVRNRKPQS